MIKEIRRFNEAGIEDFRKSLHMIKAKETDELPIDICGDRYLSEIVNTDIKIEQRIFLNKEDIIKYIYDNLQKLFDKNIFYDQGLWTWLAAYYFESLCPKQKNGERIVREDGRYILNSEDWNKYYRHLLASPVKLFKELGHYSKIYLAGKPDVLGDLFEQLASRQEIATCKGVIEAATILYWDAENEKIKKRARNKDGAGVLRRFTQDTIPQFQMTYDLNSMRGENLIKLLPNEYKNWLPNLEAEQNVNAT